MQKLHGIMRSKNIGFNIKRIRDQKGYSQEFMASQLNISQASYARMESEEIKLTVERLQKIADVLETDIAAILDASKVTIQNQINKEGGNGYVENQHIETKETFKKLIQALENENTHLKAEIAFLRSLIRTNKD
jgi:transcriptional regulator with XRE-family HTH domain